MLRTFYGNALLTADWSGEYEEKSAQWFELFLDLIMFAACSNVADGLKEDLTLHSWLQFVVICSTYSAAWHAYTHFNARFSETSLLHHVFLYILLIGLGSMVLASEPGSTFTAGLILIRVALLCMNASVYMSLPQGRVRAKTDMVLDIIITLLFVVTLCVKSLLLTLVVYAITSVTQIMFALFVAQTSCFSSSRIPMNIDHIADREGCLVMVALGESVVSAVINSRQLEHELPTKFYTAMQLSVFIIFALAIFYFAARPPRDMHAMRRSVYTGAAFTIMHYILLPTLLAVGVGTKLVSEAVLHREPLSNTALWLLFGSISLSLVEMYIVRALHYWGRQPSPNDPVPVKRIQNIWWVICGVCPVFPLIAAGILDAANSLDPIIALVVAASLALLWLITETAIMHSLRRLGFGSISQLRTTGSEVERQSYLPLHDK